MTVERYPNLLSTAPVQRAGWQRALGMTISRSALFLALQLLLAGIFALAGRSDALFAAAAWWPVTVGLANLINFALLRRLLRQEGSSFRELARFARPVTKKDLPMLILLVALTGPVSMAPNQWLAGRLFGSPEGPLAVFLQPLPTWGLALGFALFPITIGLTELPNYYGYAMPRLEAATGKAWLAVLLPVLFHAAQHIFLPLVLEPRFILWRGLMFLPFALLCALMLRWRPRLLPYMMVIHGLIDFSILPLYFM